MIVVDTNIVAYLWIPGEHTEVVEQVFKKDSKWAVPLLWRSEFRSVLFGYIRSKKMDVGTAIQTAEAAQKSLTGMEFAVSFYKVLELVFKSSCSAYDCEYVALAQDLRAPLLTIDKKIIKAFPKVAVSAYDYLKK